MSKAEEYYESLHHSGPFQHHHIVAAYEQGVKDMIEVSVKVLAMVTPHNDVLYLFKNLLEEYERGNILDKI